MQGCGYPCPYKDDYVRERVGAQCLGPGVGGNMSSGEGSYLPLLEDSGSRVEEMYRRCSLQGLSKFKQDMHPGGERAEHQRSG